jgi:hypothetical protein
VYADILLLQPQMVTVQPPSVSKLRLWVYHVAEGSLLVVLPLLEVAGRKGLCYGEGYNQETDGKGFRVHQN